MQVFKDRVVDVLLGRCEIIQVDPATASRSLPTIALLEVVPGAASLASARCVPIIDAVEGLWVLVSIARNVPIRLLVSVLRAASIHSLELLFVDLKWLLSLCFC